MFQLSGFYLLRAPVVDVKKSHYDPSKRLILDMAPMVWDTRGTLVGA